MARAQQNAQPTTHPAIGYCDRIVAIRITIESLVADLNKFGERVAGRVPPKDQPLAQAPTRPGLAGELDQAEAALRTAHTLVAHFSELF